MTPGSKAAIAEGCTCPVFDNARGAGVSINGERHFWYSTSCPIHGLPTSSEPDDGAERVHEGPVHADQTSLTNKRKK